MQRLKTFLTNWGDEILIIFMMFCLGVLSVIIYAETASLATSLAIASIGFIALLNGYRLDMQHKTNMRLLDTDSFILKHLKFVIDGQTTLFRRENERAITTNASADNVRTGPTPH